jgi:predicted dehydrogenase
MKMLRYGILSTASIVPRFISALRESGSGEVIAIASRSTEKAREKAALWNIEKSYGSYEELLSDNEVDAAYIAMINSEHYRYALMALEHGKHVVCEKPFTLKKEEAKQLFKTAAQKKLFIAEAQKAVFLPVMRDISELIFCGKLGRIHFADFTSSCASGYNEWLHSKEAGGGALYGSAGYSVSLAQYLFDCECSAYSGLCTKGESVVDEQCVINLRLSNNVMVVSKISTNVLAVNKAYIYGELGYIEIDDYWKARTATVHYNSGETQVIDYPCKYEIIYELEHFNRCIRYDMLQSPIMNEKMTVGTIEIMENLQKSWE